ncbi:MAG: hypothetical protein KJ955_05805 [Nanoarchaeota archaeon]|nr:hypothetical protein [Nanoarchaeota archaeon]
MGKMEKRNILRNLMALAPILAGCSMPAALPAPNHQPAVWRQPAPEYNAPLCNNNPTVRMDDRFYTIDCDGYSFSYMETDAGCTARLLYEAEDERKRVVDYGCDENIDIYWHWMLRHRPNYSYYQLVEESSPATQEQADEYNQTLEGIGQREVDARWRFRYHAPPRGKL